ncbi:unnamed protein product [Caenorhabditis auriculariae]|uniref:Uncharacterized protein n=1 Tax=Caenorhabditis auriculariae TaxID=2777116 RepID=A0A8S1HGY2_9PELO|nr:unnamed protein product [Caenorhabditis auriculariae]
MQLKLNPARCCSLHNRIRSFSGPNYLEMFANTEEDDVVGFDAVHWSRRILRHGYMGFVLGGKNLVQLPESGFTVTDHGKNFGRVEKRCRKGQGQKWSADTCPMTSATHSDLLPIFFSDFRTPLLLRIDSKSGAIFHLAKVIFVTFRRQIRQMALGLTRHVFLLFLRPSGVVMKYRMALVGKTNGGPSTDNVEDFKKLVKLVIQTQVIRSQNTKAPKTVYQERKCVTLTLDLNKPDTPGSSQVFQMPSSVGGPLCPRRRHTCFLCSPPHVAGAHVGELICVAAARKFHLSVLPVFYAEANDDGKNRLTAGPHLAGSGG